MDTRTTTEISAFSKAYEPRSTFVVKSGRICAGVVSVILREVLTAEGRKANAIPNDQATCWELWLKNRQYDLDTVEGQNSQKDLLFLSLERDPSHVYSHASLAFAYAYSANIGAYRNAPERRENAKHHLELALSLEKKDPFVMHSCVMALVHLGEVDRASELGDVMYAYFPVWGWSPYPIVLLERGDYADALELLEEHTRYHPEPDPMKGRESIIILLLNNKLSEALRVALRMTSFHGSSFVNWALYANVLGYLGRYDEASEAWNRGKELAHGLSVERWQKGWSRQFHNQEVPNVLTDGLRKAGLA